jgi:hypothetical protein
MYIENGEGSPTVGLLPETAKPIIRSPTYTSMKNNMNHQNSARDALPEKFA